MITRAKAGIFKTRHQANIGTLGYSGLLCALLISIEPKGFKSTEKNPVWLAATDEETQALQNNRTWILVPRPANTNIVGSKWVFRTKFLSDGSIEHLKARLVSKGYTQVLDYKQGCCELYPLCSYCACSESPTKTYAYYEPQWK
ncbi:uncharacterized protein LOC111399219 [Olea europaea var. sylvestris]|uniref:uncharacterized protein LOC111399219 n=1 Tax=Olea europaea var. sylvestris TaxID=158386 RepID=UPI000C1CEAFF|nr:uncharacterized protein LOC111399219 [Olea europaea var. sylvestris]